MSDHVFPQNKWAVMGEEGTYPLPFTGGLTKRELFAALAMQSLLATDDYPRDLSKSVTKDAVVLADRLLAELAEPVSK